MRKEKKSPSECKVPKNSKQRKESEVAQSCPTLCNPVYDSTPAAKEGEALYNQQKQDWELPVAQIMNFLVQNSDLN